MTLLTNGASSVTANGLGTGGASTADFTLLTTATDTLFANTVKGLLAVSASDGTYGIFLLPQGSTTPALVIGTSGSVKASPDAGFWGVAHSGSNWTISNQTTGTLSFRKLGLLGG